MILTVFQPTLLTGNEEATPAKTFAKYENMYNSRYYRSFHGISSQDGSNDRTAVARHKLTSILSTKVSDNSKSTLKTTLRASSSAAGLLDESRRSNSSPCLDEIPSSSQVSQKSTSQACPYAVSKHRSSVNFIPSMYGTSWAVGSARTKNSQSQAANVANGDKDSAGKGNKVANLKNKFDSMTEKAREEEIMPGKKNGIQKTINGYAGKPTVLAKSSTMPNCIGQEPKKANKAVEVAVSVKGKRTPMSAALSKPKSFVKCSTMPNFNVPELAGIKKVEEVSVCVKGKRAPMSAKLSGPKPVVKCSAMSNCNVPEPAEVKKFEEVPISVKGERIPMSTTLSEAKPVIKCSTMPNCSVLEPVKKIEEVPISIKGKVPPMSASLSKKKSIVKCSTTPNCSLPEPPGVKKVGVVPVKKGQMNSVKVTIKNFERSVSEESTSKPKNDLNSAKIPIPPKAITAKPQTSHLHSKAVPNLHGRNVDGTKDTKAITLLPKEEFVRPNYPIPRKLIARKDISRDRLGKAPEPPKPPAPVPKPRKCGVEKTEHIYLNKDDVRENVNEKPKNGKSKSLPNQSFLWNYREFQGSSTETLDSISSESQLKSNDSENGEYFEDPYDYGGNIVEYASTSLEDDPIYMEANFLDSNDVPNNPANEAIYAVTTLNKHKDSEESDEGWIDVSENEYYQCKSPNNYPRARVKKKGSNRKGKLKRLSWSHSFQRLNQSEINKYGEYGGNKNPPIQNDDADQSSDNYSINHQYEALYEIINKSSISRDVDAVPQLPERDHSPLPACDKAASKDSGINDFKSQTMNIDCDNDENSGIAKLAGEKLRKIKRNWSLTKSDFRLELSSRLHRFKPKKTSKSAADIGAASLEHCNSCDLKDLDNRTNFKSKLLSPRSPTKENARFYIEGHKVSRDGRPRSTSYTLPCSSEESIASANNPQTLHKVSRPMVSPPLPPGKRPVSSGSSAGTSSSSSSIYMESRASNYEAIWKTEKNDEFSVYQINQVRKSLRSASELDHPKRCDSKKDSTGANKGNPAEPDVPKDTNGSKMFLNLKANNQRKVSISTVSGGNDLKPLNQDSSAKSPVDEEPFYQFYHANMKNRSSIWNNSSDSSGSDQSHESHYEALNDVKCEDIPEKQPSFVRHLSTIKILQSKTKLQTLWCELPEVKASGILENLSSQERKQQEAIFEVMTSEASYLKSLDVLITHFMNCPEFVDEFSTNCVLSRHEKHVLFSDVLPVYEVSQRLLSAFEQHWKENIRLSNICDILYEHANKYFNVYVKYCSNQIYLERQYQELRENKPEFVEVMKHLESSPVCQNLTMHSFLMLPMQRITRLPLLVDAIYHRLDSQTYLYDTAKRTLACLNKIVADCNEGARKMERMEEMLRISHQIDFKDRKGVPLISSNRWLVKRGDLTKLSFSDNSGKKPFGKVQKCTKSNVYLFLFTDLLLVTKRKGDNSFAVIDYCPRNMVQVSAIREENYSKLSCRPPEGCKNLFQFTMLQNHDGKTVELIFCCNLESDRMRWMEAVTPPTSENPDEKIYEEWDCPQFQVTHSYQAQQPDELMLEELDVVNVLRKMADGWYQGERIRDGVQGWFPANHTEEIISSHVRARNLRQRYRLLAASHSYLLKAQKLKSK